MIILALKLSISALTQSCDALEKSQILSRRNIIQFLKPHNNPNDETTKLDKKNKEITDLIEEKHTELMTAWNVGAWTQAWQAKCAVFKIEGFVCKRTFLPFFPTPSPFFYLRHFRAVFHSCSSFFAAKPHRNACYAGYLIGVEGA